MNDDYDDNDDNDDINDDNMEEDDNDKNFFFQKYQLSYFFADCEPYVLVL